MHVLKPIALGAALLVGGGTAVSLLGNGGEAANVEKVKAAAAKCTYFPANRTAAETLWGAGRGFC